MVKIFITGVTGYVGGDFLYNISKKQPSWQITSLIRTEAKAELVRAHYPKVRTVLGDNNSTELIETEAANADIVFHFANSADDEPSARAIATGLSKTGGYWIHTSGAYILTRPNASPEILGTNDGEDYDDWEGIDRLINLPDNAPHRDIDKIVLATGNDKVKTAIVCPPMIYGIGRGPDNKVSMEPYASARTVLKNKEGFIYKNGENVWHQVHVADLTDLFVLLGEAAVAGGGQATWNQEGYYLAEDGPFTSREVLEGIAEYAHKKGYIPSSELEQVDATATKGQYPIALGTTSKGTSYRAKKLLGWTPTKTSVLEGIPDVVEYEAEKLGLL